MTPAPDNSRLEMQQDTNSVTQEFVSAPVQTKTTLQLSRFSIEKIINATKNGGSNGIEISGSCSTSECFSEKFKQCAPANGTLKTAANGVYSSEILGPKDGGCSVKSKVKTHPNPTWVGKEMNCIYDNTKELDVAVMDISRCDGELVTLLIQSQLGPLS